MGQVFERLVNNVLEGMILDSDPGEEMTKEDILGDIARFAGRDIQTIRQAAYGQTNCPPEEVVDAFARVTGIPASAYMAALSRDGCDIQVSMAKNEDGEKVKQFKVKTDKTWSKIEKDAEEIMKSQEGLTKEQAVAKVIKDKPEVYEKYLKEME